MKIKRRLNGHAAPTTRNTTVELWTCCGHYTDDIDTTTKRLMRNVATRPPRRVKTVLFLPWYSQGYLSMVTGHHDPFKIPSHLYTTATPAVGRPWPNVYWAKPNAIFSRPTIDRGA